MGYKVKWLLVLIVLAVSCGCAAPVKHSTKSGKPEVTIYDVTPDEVKTQLTNEMINKGYNLKHSGRQSQTFERQVDNALGAALYGSRYDGKPNARIVYTVIPVGENVRMVADLKIVTNPGSAFERTTAMNNSQDSSKVQRWMTDLKDYMEISHKEWGSEGKEVVDAVNSDAASAVDVSLINNCSKDVLLLKEEGARKLYSAPCASGKSLVISCDNGKCDLLD